MNKSVWDRLVAFGAAVSGTVLTLLVDQHVIGSGLAADIAGIVTAAVGAYHGGSVITARSSQSTKTVSTYPQP